MEINEARELLNHIPCNKVTHNEWVNVGMAFHYEGLPCSLWEEWSATDTKRYHPGECERRWQSFGNYGGTEVTIGTVYHIAHDYGWKPANGMKTYDWDDIITIDDKIDSKWNTDSKIQELPAVQDDYSPINDITDYLSSLFEPDDKVCITTTASLDEDRKWHPRGGSDSRTCKQLLDSLAKNKESSISDTFGTINNNSGAWICFNPTNGNGRKDSNITAFRYALIESDDISINEQWEKIHALRLPVAIAVHSGGKSLHAIVRIDAKDPKEYSERVQILYDYCKRNDYPVDTNNRNPSRLSRLPGMKRGDNWQYIVGKGFGPKSWEEWNRTVLNPFPIDIIDGRWEDLPPLKPELIHDILRRKHKLIFVSGSKAGKSFTLIQLSVCIAEGQTWMGYKCEQGKVLYINLEIDRESFLHRIEKVYRALELTPSGNLTAITLRGQRIDIDSLMSLIPKEQYAAIIIDPFYKLGVEDENAAGDVAKFCCALDTISEKYDAAIIYCHHHSKGEQSGKNSMDRASGSGVFARDADAMIDLLELAFPPEYEDNIKEKYGNDCIPCKMDFTLREFPRKDPKTCFFSYPLLYEDKDRWLDNAHAADVERRRAAGRQQGALENQLKKENNISDLKGRIKKDISTGEKKTQRQYAEEMGVGEKTIGRWKDSDQELQTLFEIIKQDRT